MHSGTSRSCGRRVSLEALTGGCFHGWFMPGSWPVLSKNCPLWFHILLPAPFCHLPIHPFASGTSAYPTLSQSSSASLGSWLLCQSPLSGRIPPSSPWEWPFRTRSSLWPCAHPSALSQELSLRALSWEASKSQAGFPPTGSASLVDGGPEKAWGWYARSLRQAAGCCGHCWAAGSHVGPLGHPKTRREERETTSWIDLGGPARGGWG